MSAPAETSAARPRRSKDLRLAGVDENRVYTGPETVHIDVTNGCNTNCITCWDHSPLLLRPRTAAWKRQRVDPDAIEALLDDIITLGGLRAVILSGMGEPFTHPEIYQMIAAVKSRGLHLTIITNLVAADVDRIVALGVDDLLIGIHGASETAYRAFHPSFQNGEWERLHSMLARLRDAGRRCKHVHVICRDNAHELVEMIRQARTYDARRVNFKLASLREGTEACRIDDAQRRQLLGDLVPRAASAAAALGVETNLDVFAHQLAAGGGGDCEATADIADVGCLLGWSYARILVDGTVLYCCNTAVRVGSLAGGDAFSQLWNGPAWNGTRARLRRGEYFDGCHQCGKIVQNVKLARRFAAAYGEERLREVTGRGKP